MKLLAPFAAMQRRGMKVNDKLRLERIAALGGEAERLKAECQPIVQSLRGKLKRPELIFKQKVCKGCRNGKLKRVKCLVCNGAGKFENFEFKPSSDEQVGDLLYNAIGLPARTKDSKWTVDEEALQSLVALDKTGIVLKFLRYNKLSTIEGTYARLAPDGTGHVHCVYNPAGAYTGRCSHAEAFYVANSTNLGNLAADMEAKRDPLFAVREVLVPDEGEVFIEADLSQSEARIVACLSEDKFLLDNWIHGDGSFDVHKWTAAQTLSIIESRQVTEKEVSKPQRQINGKRPRHALNYGEGATKFWRTTNADADVTGIAITLTTAKAICKAYHALHPNLDKVWWTRVEAIANAGAVIETAFGRICQFYPRFDPYSEKADAETLRAMVAFEPQSTSVDLLNTGLLALWAMERGNGFRVLHQGHDSVLVGAQRDRARHVARLMKACLEREMAVNGVKFVIPVEVFICPQNWGQKEKIL